MSNENSKLDAERAAFQAYLDDCREHDIEPSGAYNVSSGKPCWDYPKPSLLKDCNVTYSNSSRPLADQGERQEAVARVGMVPGTDFKSLDFFKTDLQELPVGTMLYTTPQPGPDVRGLVDDLVFLADYIWRDSCGHTLPNYLALGRYPLDVAKAALAAHRQAQRKGDQP